MIGLRRMYAWHAKAGLACSVSASGLTSVVLFPSVLIITLLTSFSMLHFPGCLAQVAQPPHLTFLSDLRYHWNQNMEHREFRAKSIMAKEILLKRTILNSAEAQNWLLCSRQICLP